VRSRPMGGVTFGDHTAVPPSLGASVEMLIGQSLLSQS
jgi:hypothetical protein